MKEITPAHLRCTWADCPGVFDMGDGNLLIVGKCPKTGEEREVILGKAYFAELRQPEDQPG